MDPTESTGIRGPELPKQHVHKSHPVPKALNPPTHVTLDSVAVTVGTSSKLRSRSRSRLQVLLSHGHLSISLTHFPLRYPSSALVRVLWLMRELSCSRFPTRKQSIKHSSYIKPHVQKPPIAENNPPTHRALTTQAHSQALKTIIKATSGASSLPENRVTVTVTVTVTITVTGLRSC
jgi:hypothetical protein